MHRLAIKERQRNLDAERMERARAEANAVTTGVAETVSLQEARGQVFAHPVQKRGERRKPIRKTAPVETLGATKAQEQAGHRYGEMWRALQPDGNLRSGLDFTVRGGEYPAEARAKLWADLHRARLSLMYEPRVIELLDNACGREVSLNVLARGDTDQRNRLKERLVEALEGLRAHWRL